MASRCLFTSALVLCAAHAARAETGFLNRAVSVAGTSYRYVVYVPEGWTATRKWPVILFLHGSVEKGDDGVAQSRVGLGGIVHLHPEKYPALIVMPQCRVGADWSSPKMKAQALAALDAPLKSFVAIRIAPTSLDSPWVDTAPGA